MKESYLMRSLMFVPAHNQKLLDSSVRRDADVLLLDIEDSVPMPMKQQARENIKVFAQRADLNGKALFPRVNDRESGELLKDAYQLTVDGIAGFMYPKATKEEDVYFFGKLLETIEYEKGYPIGTFKIIPLIETAGAIVNIKEICHACTRVIAVAFGCEDYVTDLQGKHDAEGQSIFYARNAIVNAAREAGVVPIDTVHIHVHDLEDLEKNLVIARNLGFEGMLVLNPKELPFVHKYFSPTKEEIAWAAEMIQLSEEAVREGKGVAVKDNKFIGPPMVKMAQGIILKNEMISKKAEERNVSNFNDLHGGGVKWQHKKHSIKAISKEDCCGCAACQSICPTGAIIMQPDKEGFLYPQIDDSKCIDCGLCHNTCVNVRPFNYRQTVYAAWHKEDNIRACSSSGGIFTSLSRYIMRDGGKVCAVGYSEDCEECLHQIIESESDLDNLRRAKFVQSNKYDIYHRCKKILEDGTMLLFCGTPCECGALRQYLQREYDNLITADLICGCVSSPKVYRKYISFLEDKYDSKVVSVNFKDKRNGWRGKAIAVRFENGEEYYNSIFDDDYCVSFHSRFNLRPSCFNCKYRSLQRSADITLGDFWAIEKYNPDYDDDKGTSFVLTNTPKGDELINSLKDIVLHRMDISLDEYCSNYNWCMHKNPVAYNNERDVFYKDLEEMPFDEMALKNLEKIKIERKRKKLGKK